MRELALGGGGEQLRRHRGEDAIVAEGVLAQRVHELGGHEGGIASGAEEVAEAGVQLLPRGVLQGEPNPDAGAVASGS